MQRQQFFLNYFTRVICPLFSELTQKGSTLGDPVVLRLFGRQMDKNNKVCGVSYKRKTDMFNKIHKEIGKSNNSKHVH